MPSEIRAAGGEGGEILLTKFGDRDAAVILQCAHGRDQHHHLWLQTCYAALDVNKFLGAKIGAEARFGHRVIRELERSARSRHGIAPVRDIGERPAVHNR